MNEFISDDNQPAPHHMRLFDVLHRHTAQTPGPTPTPTIAPSPIAVDVKEDPRGVTVFMDLPGVDEDDIHIDLHSNVLMVATRREFDHDNEDAEEYVVLERCYGPLKRVVNVPGTLDEVGMTAKYRRGVLKVRIPKLKVKEIP